MLILAQSQRTQAQICDDYGVQQLIVSWSLEWHSQKLFILTHQLVHRLVRIPIPKDSQAFISVSQVYARIMPQKYSSYKPYSVLPSNSSMLQLPIKNKVKTTAFSKGLKVYLPQSNHPLHEIQKYHWISKLKIICVP